jgi:hypothetical protein
MARRLESPTSARNEEDLFTALALGGAGGAQLRAKVAPAPQRQSIFYWLPVFVALVLFAQVALLGLRPALRESNRLTVAEGLLDRYGAQQERSHRLARILRAQSDPIYLERERRALLDPESDLLRR